VLQWSFRKEITLSQLLCSTPRATPPWPLGDFFRRTLFFLNRVSPICRFESLLRVLSKNPSRTLWSFVSRSFQTRPGFIDDSYPEVSRFLLSFFFFQCSRYPLAKDRTAPSKFGLLVALSQPLLGFFGPSLILRFFFFPCTSLASFHAS